MAGKAKGVPRDTTITLRLPREVHDLLKEAAAGRSVSEEIRARLEWSIVNDWTNDPKTGDVVDAIANLARNVAPYFGHWHKNRYAFDVFKIAIDTVLTKVRPKGELIPPADDGEFRPGDTPEAAGRALAAAEIIARGL
jgi:Arc-like DNA binding domain